MLDQSCQKHFQIKVCHVKFPTQPVHLCSYVIGEEFGEGTCLQNWLPAMSCKSGEYLIRVFIAAMDFHLLNFDVSRVFADSETAMWHHEI